jgi:hypothetical protein
MYEPEGTKNTGEERDKGALVLGTILSVPLFLFCFFVVAVVSYVVYTFFMSVQGGEVNRLVQLAGTVISSIAGAAAGRWVCDKAFREWSGWPALVAMILIGLANAYAIFQGYSDGVWEATLQFVQVAAALGATWYFAVKKVDMT